MTKEIIIKSLDELEKFAKEFSKNLKGNEIILLEGDLGAGKTTFTKYLLKHLGVEEDVVSPTFTIMNEYDGKFNIYHIDMYRIDRFDISDIVGRGIIIIEWPKDEEYSSYGVDVYKISIDILEDSRVFKVERLS